VQFYGLTVSAQFLHGNPPYPIGISTWFYHRKAHITIGHISQCIKYVIESSFDFLIQHSQLHNVMVCMTLGCYLLLHLYGAE